MIDTQIVVWSLLTPDRLSATARQALDTASRVHASAASLYEIEYKRGIETKRGRRSLLHDLPLDLPDHLAALGLTFLDITPTIAFMAAQLEIDHGDPWDRIILAQAMALGVPLISSDTRLRNQTDTTPVIW